MSIYGNLVLEKTYTKEMDNTNIIAQTTRGYTKYIFKNITVGSIQAEDHSAGTYAAAVADYNFAITTYEDFKKRYINKNKKILQFKVYRKFNRDKYTAKSFLKSEDRYIFSFEIIYYDNSKDIYNYLITTESLKIENIKKYIFIDE